jgi:hypothetical protein
VRPLQQVARLRDEEASEECWFMLPEAGDDDVNWMDFEVEIMGPVSGQPSAARERVLQGWPARPQCAACGGKARGRQAARSFAQQHLSWKRRHLAAEQPTGSYTRRLTRSMHMLMRAADPLHD